MNVIAKGLLALFGLKPSDVEKRLNRDPSQFNYIELLRSGLDPVTGFAQISQDRIIRYTDFDMMDGTSDMNVALDIYAEEATQTDPRTNRVVWIEAKDEKIEAEGQAWCRRLRLDERSFGLARNIAKYGDLFEYLLISSEGVYNMQFIHPSRVGRVETDRLIGFSCPDLARLVLRAGGGGTQEEMFMPWDFVHLRMEVFDRESIYGKSYLEGLRKIWKELQILETMVAIFRVTKAVERKVFYVDVSDSSQQEVKKLMDTYRDHLKKNKFIDPITGDFRIDVNAITPLEDIIFPIRGDNKSRVENLTQSPDIGALEDLHYFRTKLRAGLGIPKAYFDQDTEGMGFHANQALALQDMRFSRKIQRLQRSVRAGLTRAFAIHLTLKGIAWKPGEFLIKMAPVNQIYEQLKEEWWLKRAELANVLIPIAALAGFDQKRWNQVILPEIFHLTQEAIEKLTSDEDTPEPADPNDPDADAPLKQAAAKIPTTVGKFPQFAPPSSLADDIDFDMDSLPKAVRSSLTEVCGGEAALKSLIIEARRLSSEGCLIEVTDVYNHRDEVRAAAKRESRKSTEDPKEAIDLGGEMMTELTMALPIKKERP
jgi:Bacteriophage T4-like portal protein (Gp20)